MLEQRGLSLTKSINIVTSFKSSLENIPGNFGLEICKKFDRILNNNPDFNALHKISRIYCGENIEGPEEIDSKLWSKFQFAPITSCDVERSFSAYKMILTDKRHNMTTQNLEKLLVVYCELNYS